MGVTLGPAAGVTTGLSAEKKKKDVSTTPCYKAVTPHDTIGYGIGFAKTFFPHFQKTTEKTWQKKLKTII